MHTRVSTGSHPRAASLPGGGHTPLSSRQLPSRPPLCCWTPASPKSGCSRPVAGLRSGEPCSPLLEPPEAQPAPLRPPSLPNELLAHRAQGQGGQLGSQPASPGRASDEFKGLASCHEQAKTQAPLVLRFPCEMLENGFFPRSQLFEGSLASV